MMNHCELNFGLILRSLQLFREDTRHGKGNCFVGTELGHGIFTPFAFSFKQAKASSIFLNPYL